MGVDHDTLLLQAAVARGLMTRADARTCLDAVRATGRSVELLLPERRLLQATLPPLDPTLRPSSAARRAAAPAGDATWWSQADATRAAPPMAPAAPVSSTSGTAVYPSSPGHAAPGRVFGSAPPKLLPGSVLSGTRHLDRDAFAAPHRESGAAGGRAGVRGAPPPPVVMRVEFEHGVAKPDPPGGLEIVEVIGGGSNKGGTHLILGVGGRGSLRARFEVQGAPTWVHLVFGHTSSKSAGVKNTFIDVFVNDHLLVGAVPPETVGWLDITPQARAGVNEVRVSFHPDSTTVYWLGRIEVRYGWGEAPRGEDR